MKNTTAVILAAGQGKRIEPLITPKPLLPFMGKPLIEWIIENLKKAGLKKMVLVVNPKHENKFKSLTNKHITLAFQNQPKGMADAIVKTQKAIKTETMIVVNGDDLLPFNTYKQLVKTAKKNKSNPAVTGFKVKKHYPGGYLKLKNNLAVGIVEKPVKGYEPSQYLNLVAHYFPQTDKFVDQIKKSRSKKDDLYEVALNKLMQSTQVNLVKNSDFFAPIKYPHHLLDVVKILLKLNLKNKKNFIHPTAKVMPGATIINSYIGPNVTVGSNVLVRDSIVEEGSVIGYNTEIARSYVGPKSWFHCNYVGDSVIEGHTNMGSGARLANLRFDNLPITLKQPKNDIPTKKIKLGSIIAKGAKLGINASIMPGMTIGSNAIIGSGVVLHFPVSKDTKIYLKQDLIS